MAAEEISAEKEAEALRKEHELTRKALFLDEAAGMLEEKLNKGGYSLADFLDHIFNPDRKFPFDW